MGRFFAAAGGHRGILAVALLAAFALAGPAAAVNTNLTATAKYSASSAWQEDQGNTTFVAAKAFDGDLTTRWNSYAGMAEGEWLAANWDSPVTINKVVVRQAFDRITGFRVQRLDAGTNDWVDEFVAEDDKYAAVTGGDPANPTHTVRLAAPIQTAGVRVLFTGVKSTSLSIFEVEAWNNPAGTLTGTVTDPAGQPIQGALVRAGSETATTGADGKYTMTADVGQYTVVAGKPGAYRDRRARGVEIAANTSATQDFVLQPEPPNLARSATAVSSSDWEDGPDYNAAKANDGNLTTRWNSRAGDIGGATLELQWAEPQTFNRIVIREAIGRIRNYTLQRHDEATDSYVPILTTDAPPGTGDRVLTHLLAAPITTKRLQLLVNEADEVPTVWEFEVANAPIGTARGVVQDVTSGKVVASAEILNDAGVVVATSNEKGEFSLPLEPDEYVLTARATGYFPGAPALFTIDAGQTRDLTLALPPQGANIALTGKAAASSEQAGYEAALAIDGDLDTNWLADGDVDQWIGVTWDKPTHLTVVQLRGFHATIQRSFLQVLDADGKTWVDLPGTTFNPEFLAGKPADFFFPNGVTTTGLRYFITATNSAGSTPGLSELMAFDSPLPKP